MCDLFTRFQSALGSATTFDKFILSVDKKSLLCREDDNCRGLCKPAFNGLVQSLDDFSSPDFVFYVVQSLLEHGFEPLECDKNGIDSIMCALQYGKFGTAQFLLREMSFLFSDCDMHDELVDYLLEILPKIEFKNEWRSKVIIFLRTVTKVDNELSKLISLCRFVGEKQVQQVEQAQQVQRVQQVPSAKRVQQVPSAKRVQQRNKNLRANKVVRIGSSQNKRKATVSVEKVPVERNVRLKRNPAAARAQREAEKAARLAEAEREEREAQAIQDAQDMAEALAVADAEIAQESEAKRAKEREFFLTDCRSYYEFRCVQDPLDLQHVVFDKKQLDPSEYCYTVALHCFSLGNEKALETLKELRRQFPSVLENTNHTDRLMWRKAALRTTDFQDDLLKFLSELPTSKPDPCFNWKPNRDYRLD